MSTAQKLMTGVSAFEFDEKDAASLRRLLSTIRDELIDAANARGVKIG